MKFIHPVDSWQLLAMEILFNVFFYCALRTVKVEKGSYEGGRLPDTKSGNHFKRGETKQPSVNLHQKVRGERGSAGNHKKCQPPPSFWGGGVRRYREA